MESTAQTPGLPSQPAGDGTPPTEPDLSGQTLGEFQVLRRLGQGGMGQVYVAEQRSLKRKVALKILKPDVAGNPTSLARFRSEAELVARATHANIVQVYAFGESAGQHYMALEFVEGRNLREYVAKKGPPDVLLALSIMRQVASALQRAHELGIIHRDIKPENILLTRKGEVKVADFGLSRCLDGDQPLNLTASGVTMGTPLYMSPEQVEGKPIDARTDLYSFGVTCYHMLAGEPPFRGNNAFQVAQQHVYHEPTPLATIRPDLPAELCAVVHKLMAKSPDDRYPTCGELLKDLLRLREALSAGGAGFTQAVSLSGIASGPVEAAVKEPVATPPHRGRWLLAAFAGSLVLAAAGGVTLAWIENRTPHVGAGQANSSGATDVEPGEALTSPERREAFMREAVKQYEKPKDRTMVLMGVGHCLELGIYLLDEWRLDDAEAFFKGLIDNLGKVDDYSVLGRLGYAIVLALRNQAADSKQLFLKVAGGKQSEVFRNPLLLADPSLRQWIRKALDYNNANLKERTPPELNYLFNRPPNLPIGPRPGDRPPGRPAVDRME